MTIKQEEMVGHVESMEMRNTYTILVGKIEGNRPLGRPRRSCEDCLRSVQEWALVNSATISFSRRALFHRDRAL